MKKLKIKIKKTLARENKSPFKNKSVAETIFVVDV
jgi:hypothetical protein